MKFELLAADDFHTHLRDDARTPLAARHTAESFARCMAMPNTVPPVTDAADAMAYKAQIDAVKPHDLQVFYTLYLTEKTTPEMIFAAAANPHIIAVKLYPAGATTNSDNGVRDIFTLPEVLNALSQSGLPLCVHGEVVDDSIDIFDRERVFYATTAPRLLEKHPALKLVAEHITTRDAADFVRSAGANVACTITPQHLLYNRNQLLAGGLRPHYYCLPVLKREEDRAALIALATSGFDRAFAGTDSAPHAQNRKESACGCAGCYTAAQAVGLCAEAFDEAIDLSEGASQMVFEAFMSRNGAQFYGLPVNQKRITIEKKETPIPTHYAMDSGEKLVPLRAGGTVGWRVLSCA